MTINFLSAAVGGAGQITVVRAHPCLVTHGDRTDTYFEGGVGVVIEGGWRSFTAGFTGNTRQQGVVSCTCSPHFSLCLCSTFSARQPS